MKEFTLEKIRKHPDYERIYKEEDQLLDIAIKLAEAREKKKISQKKLAELAETNQSVVSRIESGVENLSLKKLFRIANALGVKVNIKLG